MDTAIGLAFALAHGVMYSTGFALALPGQALVATLVIMAVTANAAYTIFSCKAAKEPP